MDDCVFCKIIANTLPADLVYADGDFIVIRDIHHLAPLHLLVIPRRHVTSMNALTNEDADLVGRLLLTARKVALAAVGSEGGYRLVINTGREGGQTIFHLHLHILAGKHISPELLVSKLE